MKTNSNNAARKLLSILLAVVFSLGTFPQTALTVHAASEANVKITKYGYELIGEKENVTDRNLAGAGLEIRDSRGRTVKSFTSGNAPAEFTLDPGTYADNYVENGVQRNRLRYCMSHSPLGPWEYKGVYLEPTDCDTSHGSVVEFKGQWYAFYHCCTLSHQGNLRSICADRLFYHDDGTIATVVQGKRETKRIK